MARRTGSHVSHLVFALLFGAVVAAAVMGSAAALTVDTTKLGSGTATISSCNSTAIATSWAATYDATLGEYKVSSVTVDGITGSTCNGATLKLTLSASGGAALGSEYSAAIATADTSKVFDTSGASIAADSVANVSAVIVGP